MKIRNILSISFRLGAWAVGILLLTWCLLHGWHSALAFRDGALLVGQHHPLVVAGLDLATAFVAGSIAVEMLAGCFEDDAPHPRDFGLGRHHNFVERRATLHHR